MKLVYTLDLGSSAARRESSSLSRATKIMKKLIVILGPTASGKTDLAKKLVNKFNGEVISADSRQIFRFMDIGTGKDKTFPQHMIDIRDPRENYTVAEYQKEVYGILDDIWSSNKIPFLVGGSMLYIDAVVYGYQFPGQNEKLRTKIEKWHTEKIYQQLKKVDPISAEKNKLNRRRLIRALEVGLLNSRPLSEYKKKKPEFQYLILGIDLPRQELYKRIDQRVNKRIKQEMIKEVENLLKMGVAYDRLQNFGLEYRYISQFLAETKNEKLKTKKEEKKQAMIQKLKFKIHAFARRQLTWWRKNPEIHWIKSQSIGWRKAEKLIQGFLEI